MATRVREQPTTKQAITNLGAGIIELVVSLRLHPITGGDDYSVGKVIDGLLKAGLKAALPGRQSDKQLKALHQALRAAVNRKLARKVAQL